MTDENLKYPVGRFKKPGPIDRDLRASLIGEIERLPADMRGAVAGLSDAQLDTPYRPGGWTIRQVVHHVPDSHMNAYIRMKIALTESNPTIRTYEEAMWAELPEARTGPVAVSLNLLEALHARWVLFLRALPEREFAKTFSHPVWGTVRVDSAIAMYVWHGRHHLAHIRQALGAA
jgi:hypothetical protein